MSVKLNKKKIIISISVLFLLISVSVVSTFAFQFKKPIDLSPSTLGRPSIEAVESLAGIINFQVEIGQLRASEFRVLAYSSSRNAMLAIISNGLLSVSVSNSNVTFSGSHFVYFYDSDYGFYYGFSETEDTFPASNIFFSSVPISGDNVNINGFNSAATFGTADYNAYTIYQYYDYIYSSCVDRDERESELVSDAFAEGLATGQGEGYQVGLEDGYNQGYDSGFADGEDRGYIEGQTEGYSEGYSEGFSEGESFGSSSGYRDGFDDGREEGYTFGYDAGYYDGYKRGDDIGYQTGFSDGYDEGYSEGYETGYQSGLDNGSASEPLQIYIAYIFRFDENNKLQYSWYNQTFGLFSWVDYQDGFDPTKPAFTFIVRLSESDLNNSSTQIQLPFDFLSSPGNRDYSVASFDPDFLTGYGTSLSLFVTTSRSYNNGYNVGLQDGADLLDGISDISAKPIAALRDALDFELFGVNIGLVAIALVSILIVFAAYKFVKKIFPI